MPEGHLDTDPVVVPKSEAEEKAVAVRLGEVLGVPEGEAEAVQA